MIATWMVYAIAVGLLVVTAAEAAERGARALRVPVRFGWSTALVLVMALPLMLPPLRAPRLIELSSDTGASSALPMAQAPLAPSAPAEVSLIDRWASAAPRLDRPLLVLWLLLSAMLLARILSAVVGTWRQRSSWARREVDGVAVYLTADLGPAVVAIPDSRIVLPEWLLALDGASIATVVRHEHQHQVAGDARMMLASSIATALMPWNPALWMIRRRLRLAVEMDCDARVLREVPHVDRYGSLLLAIAQHPRHAPRLAAALAESTSDLERRINAMTSRPAKLPRTSAAVFAAVALVAIGFACAVPAPDVVAPRPNPDVAPKQVSRDTTYLDYQVERAALANPSNRPPRYPPELRAAGIEGTVIAQFVVDTNGLAEMRTFEVKMATHPGFLDAVRDGLSEMRFSPAVVGGRKVRQLIAMPFTFSLVGSSRAAGGRIRTPPPNPVAGANTMTTVATQRAETVGTRPPVDTSSAIAAPRPQAGRGGAPEPEALTSNAPPIYPNKLRAANIEGQVTASFVILADGTADMSTFRIEKSDHDLFSEAVRNAVAKMKFKPALDASGAAVPMRTPMNFQFSLAR